MITTAVPPALACCLAIATTISVHRLRKRGVYVLDNERVALAGLLDAICFDKTGTLTEAGLELGGVVPVISAQ
jgi:cation-transporting ATPase 13A3/4/5